MNNYNQELLQSGWRTRVQMIFTKIFIAIRFLTIIPFKVKKNYDYKDVAHSVVYFPYVGLLIGTIGALFNILVRGHFYPFIKDIFVISIMIVLTGGLHLDGFIEVVDHLLKGKNEHQDPRIIKESSISAFGAIYLIILILLKFLAFNSIDEILKNKVLILFPMLSRWVMSFTIILLNKKQNDNTIVRFVDFIEIKEFFIAGIIPLIITVLAMKLLGLILVGIIILFSFLFCFYINKKIQPGSHDVFGAINEIVELLVIIFFAIVGILKF